ncbi:hypothetical protein KQR56_15745 [Bacillus velezensis]|nr:hypothetical protein [Bacillus velezensis]
MMPLQVELQRNVKATKDEAMTVEQAAELLKVHPDYIPTLVARSDDLKMIGNTIIAKRDKTNIWLVGDAWDSSSWLSLSCRECWG